MPKKREKTKILVVDDQSGIRLLLFDVLTNEGYDVSLAEDGRQALNIIAQKEFDLIILDYHLPIINGYEVLEQLNSDHFKEPIILISGLVEKLVDKGGEYNFPIEILAKPFDIKELCDLVKEVITEKEVNER